MAQNLGVHHVSLSCMRLTVRARHFGLRAEEQQSVLRPCHCLSSLLLVVFDSRAPVGSQEKVNLETS
jgi:hypothetical protein